MFSLADLIILSSSCFVIAFGGCVKEQSKVCLFSFTNIFFLLEYFELLHSNSKSGSQSLSAARAELGRPPNRETHTSVHHQKLVDQETSVAKKLEYCLIKKEGDFYHNFVN